MGILSKDQIKSILVDIYPNKFNDLEFEDSYDNNRLHVTKTSQILNDQDVFNHPYYQRFKKKDNINIKKWIAAIFLSLFATFIFSNVFIGFLDDLCMKKDVNIFDYQGNPKIIVIVVLFGLLLSLNRITFEFIDK
jgi:hypothetical protein